jgi:hypothetical protein
MSKFIQDKTQVVVSVADEKDERFAVGWKPYSDASPVSAAPARKPRVLTEK